MTQAVVVAVAMIISMAWAGPTAGSRPAGIAGSGVAVLHEGALHHRAAPGDQFTRYASVDTAALRRKIVYPASALPPHISGSVVTTIEVSATGKGRIVSTVGTASAFTAEVRRVLVRARYTAARADGKPYVQTIVLVTDFIAGFDGARVHPEIDFMIGIILPNGKTDFAISNVPHVSPKPAAPAIDTSDALEATEGPYPKSGDGIVFDRPPSYGYDDLYLHLKYPEIARRNAIEGRVVVRTLIGRSGRPVKFAIVEGGNHYLEEAAVAGIASTTFSPATLNGRPVAAWIEIPVIFSLGN